MSTPTIANTIREQITPGVLMSLGARSFCATDRPIVRDTPALPSLTFLATILPFTKAGARSTQARAMTVQVGLNGRDYYDVRVTYPKRGDKWGTRGPETHYEADDVPVDVLARLLLALDYDGPEVLNPRLA